MDPALPSLAERIASCALDKFATLPQKYKPRIHPDGRREWTPLSAAVVARGSKRDQLTCVALATGTKCLPSTVLPQCYGAVIHDSHAEVLALRGFNCWLLSELGRLLDSLSAQSDFIEQSPASRRDDKLGSEWASHQLPFRLKSDISIHLFTTEAPCGDASMELLMSSKLPEDAVPWSLDHSNPNNDPVLLGRGHFSVLGAVRRKPARADAEESLSKSCSDKLAIRQFTSLLAFPADLLIAETENAFLSSMVIYEDQYDNTGYHRAFGVAGRLSAVQDYDGQYFNVTTLSPDFKRFPFEKARGEMLNDSIKASNISAIWIRAAGPTDTDILEVILNGVKQGYKQFESRRGKESVLCRRKMWEHGRTVCSLLPETTESESGNESYTEFRRHLLAALFANTYSEAKSSDIRRGKIAHKSGVTLRLGNWIKNTGDGDWGLP